MTAGTTPESNVPLVNLQPVRIVYTNWENKTEVRNILPDRIYFGSTPYHSEQWILVATDLDKNAERHFAIKDIKCWF